MVTVIDHYIPGLFFAKFVFLRHGLAFLSSENGRNIVQKNFRGKILLLEPTLYKTKTCLSLNIIILPLCHTLYTYSARMQDCVKFFLYLV
jgi:hypothetical protein